MKLLEFLKVIPRVISKHHRPLCFIGGLMGILATAFLSVKAARKHDSVIAKLPKESTKKDKFKATWKIWVAPIVSGLITAGCFGGLYFLDTKEMNKLTLVATTAQAALSDIRNEQKPEAAPVTNVVDAKDTTEDKDELTWFYESAYGIWFQSTHSIVTNGIMMGEKHYQQTGQLTAAYLYDCWGIGWKRDERMDREGWDQTFDDKEVKWVDIHTRRFPDAEHGWYTKIWYEKTPEPFPWAGSVR